VWELAPLITMLWNGPAKGWSAGAPMDDANLNRRQTLRVGPSVAFAQIGIIGFDGTIDLAALRLYGLPEATPAIINGTPTLPLSGQRALAVETSVALEQSLGVKLMPRPRASAVWSGPLEPDRGQAAALTGRRACCFSNGTGLRYPRAECSRLRL
jgi:hypothetical protein